MNPRLFAKKVVDATIREFDPLDPNSYEKWDLELRDAEASLRKDAQLDSALLASVCAERIRIAFEAGRFDAAMTQTSSFLREFPAASGYSSVASLRVSALHEIGAHEEEAREVLELARMPSLIGSEYLYFLASFGRRHPGSLPSDNALRHKLQESIDDLRSQGYVTLPFAEESMQVDEIAVRAADELRRIHRARGEALLRESS